MGKDIQIFFPARRRVAVWCGIVFGAVLLNMYYLRGSSGYLFYFPLILLTGLFFFMLMPLLRNQRLLITGKEIRLYSFGRRIGLSFSENLREIVVRQSEIVSYRFEKDARFYQISPRAYYESEILKKILAKLMKKQKTTAAVVGM